MFGKFLFVSSLRYLMAARGLLLTGSMALLVGILLLMATSTLERRRMAPVNTASHLKLSQLKPSKKIYNSQSLSFNLAIKPDVSIVAQDQSFKKLLTLDVHPYRAKVLKSLVKKPYRVLRSVSLLLGTHARENTCDLILILDERLTSNKLPCPFLRDNDYADFFFDDQLDPGVYEARLYSTATGDQNGVSLYIATSEIDGSLWAAPYTLGESPPYYKVFLGWLERDLWSGIGYIGLLLVCFFLIFQKPMLRNWFLLMVLLYLSQMLIVKKFSGHDETAHITMFMKKWNETHEKLVVPRIFYTKVNKMLAEEEFYRLHGVAPKTGTICPHSLLSGCGISKPPMNLYGLYVHAADFFGVELREPDDFIVWAQLMNVGWILLMFFLLWWFSGTVALRVSIVILLLFGAFVSRAAAITNDFPMFIFALTSALAAVSCIVRPSVKRYILLVAIFTYSLFSIFSDFDRSWLSSIPFLCFVWFKFVLFLLERLVSPSTDKNHLLGRSYLSFSSRLNVFMGMGICLALAVYFRSFFMKFLLAGIPQDLFRSLRGLEIIRFAGAFAPETTLVVYGEYFKSALGSFVWGHSYYGSVWYILLGLLLLYFSFVGMRAFLHGSRPLLVMNVVGLFTLILSQLLIVIAIAAFFPRGNEHGFNASFANARLSAPGLASLIVLPCAGIYLFLRDRYFERALYVLCSTWVFILIYWYQVKIYFLDLY